MTTSYSAKKMTVLFKKMNQLNVFVVGDAMLDNYWMGDIERISPEAPVPIVHVTKKESRPGGAANVALNCRALGASVSLLTMLGKDEAGETLCRLLQSQEIQTGHILFSKERQTTTKTRVISKNQQLMRLDEETTEPLSIKNEHHFIDTCLKAIQIEKPDIVIFEDYNKGLLKANVIEKIITHCRHVGVFTAVDPKKSNFLLYKGVDLFKPNLKEIREAMNLPLEEITLKNLKTAHSYLFNELNHRITLITLSEYGAFIQQGAQALLEPAHLRNIADVSGAGDTVISVAAIIYYLSSDLNLTIQMANLAGGLVCEEVGVAPINKSKLLSEGKQFVH